MIRNIDWYDVIQGVRDNRVVSFFLKDNEEYRLYMTDRKIPHKQERRLDYKISVSDTFFITKVTKGFDQQTSNVVTLEQYTCIVDRWDQFNLYYTCSILGTEISNTLNVNEVQFPHNIFYKIATSGKK